MYRCNEPADRRWIAFGIAIAIALGLPSRVEADHEEANHEVEDASPESPDVIADFGCLDGLADSFGCSHVELLAWVTRSSLGFGQVSDIWGWTDPATGAEYAILGMRDATVFIDLRVPNQPVHVATLPTQSFGSIWREIKVYGNYAFIVSEAPFHGMQVFDLRQLATVTAPPQTFAATAHYSRIGTTHNIVINEETGYAYAVGTKTCLGGLHIIDIADPLHPTFAGCYSADGYTHDAQCVVYRGPDIDHQGREICFASNEDTLTIVDVTDPAAPFQVSRTGYLGQAYTHQGWLSEDQAHFFMDDELDEVYYGNRSRTFVWDVSDLDAPFVAGVHEGTTGSIDHNQFVVGDHLFQANYTSGLRILRMGDLSKGELREVGFFDSYPENDQLRFEGAWGVYPFFASGIVIVSDINRGLFVLRPDLNGVPRCNDGLDNDFDGFVDYPQDPACSGPADAAEGPRNDVHIDIRPGSDLNPIKPSSRGVIPVALLGEADFDVSDVNVATLRFGPGAAVPAHKKGAHFEDVNDDGVTDLVSHFRTQETGIQSSDQAACLSFDTLVGTAYQGCDVVNAVPRCGLGAELVLILPPLAWCHRRRSSRSRKGPTGSPGA